MFYLCYVTFSDVLQVPFGSKSQVAVSIAFRIRSQNSFSDGACDSRRAEACEARCHIWLRVANRTGRPSGHQAIRSPGHQVTRSSGHKVIRSSGHQVIRPSGRQAIRSSGHQVIRPSGCQVIRSPGHRVIRSSGHRVVRSAGFVFSTAKGQHVDIDFH